MGSHVQEYQVEAAHVIVVCNIARDQVENEESASHLDRE